MKMRGTFSPFPFLSGEKIRWSGNSLSFFFFFNPNTIEYRGACVTTAKFRRISSTGDRNTGIVAGRNCGMRVDALYSREVRNSDTGWDRAISRNVIKHQ